VSEGQGLGAIWRTLNHAPFGRYQVGRLSNLVGNWTYRVGLGWLVWELTNSSAWLGAMGFLDLAPSIFVSPIAGVLADRMDRIKMFCMFQIFALISTVALSILVYLDAINIWGVSALVLMHGTAHALAQPASHSLVPSIVPPQYLSTAFALNALSFNLSRFIGPMLAGGLIVQWGTSPAIAANAIGTGIMILVMFGIRSPSGDGKKHAKGSMVTQMRAGLAYTVQHTGISALMVNVTVFSVLAFPLTHLLPGFAANVFNMGADGLAWLTASMGIGAILQGTYLGQRGPVKGLTRWIILNLFICGVVLITLYLNSNLIIGLGLMFVFGFTLVANRVGSQILFQHAVEPEMRGRVSSLYLTIFNAGPAVGSLALGFIADVIGLTETFALAGALVIAFWLWSLPRQNAIAAAMEIELPAEAERGRPGH
jgi:predicted MFS family arabinose efflux permease